MTLAATGPHGRDRAVALRGGLRAPRRAGRGAAARRRAGLPLRRRRRALRRADHDRADRARSGSRRWCTSRRRDRLPPDGREPRAPLRRVREAGGDSVTVPLRGGRDDRAARRRGRARARPRASGSRSTRARAVADGGRDGGGVDIVLCMSIQPGLLGPGVHAGGARPHPRSCASSLPADVHIQVDGGDRRGEHPRESYEAGADLLVAGTSIFGREDLPRAYRALVQALGVSLERALELAERGRGTTHPNPLVGAVVVARRRGRRRGLARARGGPHAEVVALERGRRARARRNALRDARAVRAPRPTPPCADARRSPRESRGWSSASRDPNPGGGRRHRAAARARASRSSSSRASRRRARAERGLAHVGGAAGARS